VSTARSLLIDISPLRESAPFRRIFVARLISLIGIGLLLVSVPVQMYDLTKSSAQVGAATAVTGITTFVGMLVGGSLADRFDRKRLILIGRSGAALSFAGLAVNAFGLIAGTPSVAVLYGLAGIDGLIGALSTSALMAAVPTLIPRDQLVAVGALSALTVRIGSAVSPGIAGFIIAGAGVEWAYVIAACLATTTVLILIGLPSMPPTAPVVGHTPPKPPTGTEPAAPQAKTSLVRFIVGQRVVAGVMIVGVLAMLGAGIVALLPALVAERFDSDARATGLLYAAVAAGAMIAALTSGWLSALQRPGVVLVSALTLTFVVQILFGLAPIIWLALALLVVIGFIEAIQEVLRYAIIQHHTPGPLLGRVNGIWMAQEVGGVTVGAVVAGAFGTIWVASEAIIYYGIVMVVLSAIAALTLRSLTGVRKEPAVQETAVS
jgi:MFS transporter, ENTS family, enterobactin (siderophore) exporter